MLPVTLQAYAENLYRRFPEEFLSLGQPGLEEIFDLRPGGTWTRHISESPTEKKVEICLRRWPHTLGYPGMLPGAPFQPTMVPPPQMAPRQATPMAGPYMPQCGVQEGVMTMHPPQASHPAMFDQAHFGTAVSRPSSDEPAAFAGIDDDAMARMSRLEAQLAAMKPQIEAVVKGQERLFQAKTALAAQQQATQQQCRPTPAPAAATMPGTAAGHAAAGDTPNGRSGKSPVDSPLRERRGKSTLAVETPTKSISNGIKREESSILEDKSPARSASPAKPQLPLAENRSKSNDARPVRPAMTVDTTRIFPPFGEEGEELMSPRSPGKHSAWR